MADQKMSRPIGDAWVHRGRLPKDRDVLLRMLDELLGYLGSLGGRRAIDSPSPQLILCAPHLETVMSPMVGEERWPVGTMPEDHIGHCLQLKNALIHRIDGGRFHYDDVDANAQPDINRQVGMYELWQKGMKFEAIGRNYGTSESNVRRIVKEYAEPRGLPYQRYTRSRKTQ